MNEQLQEISTTLMLWMGINPFPQPDRHAGRRTEDKHPSGTGLSNHAGPRTSYGDLTLWAD